MDQRERDVRFLFNTVALALILMAIMHAFAPYLEEAQLRAEDKPPLFNTVPVTAQQMPSLMRNASAKPTMLVMYASWCVVCRKLLPDLIAMKQDRRLDFLNTVFVSVDDVPPRLRKYLTRNNYDGNFTPYIMSNGDHRDISTTMASSGIRYQGKIPYVAFLDRNGRMVSDFVGYFPPQDVLAHASKVKGK